MLRLRGGSVSGSLPDVPDWLQVAAQNFDEVLVPPDHVSRNPNDTYYVDPKTVLRCHTSAHQAELLRQGEKAFLVTGALQLYFASNICCKCADTALTRTICRRCVPARLHRPVALPCVPSNGRYFKSTVQQKEKPSLQAVKRCSDLLPSTFPCRAVCV